MGGVSGKFTRGEWSGLWHGALPAFAKGDEDEVSMVAEGVSIFVFLGAEDLRVNAINHELDTFVHGLMEGMVSVINWEIGGRSVIACMA